MRKPEEARAQGQGGALPRRLALGGAVLAAALAGVGGYAWVGAGGAAGGAPLFGGPFTLAGPDGPVTAASLHGRYVLTYFGYTFCPDVCPTTLNAVVQALDRLGQRADDIRVVFISVDPARDTPQVMRDYTQAISPRILGLTGTDEQIAAVARAYHVYYHVNRSGPADRSYSVDHSSVVYLQGKDGAPIGLIPADDTPAQMAAEIGKLIS